MLGALLAANIKPDMIVGASVGTLMGAALGAMFSTRCSSPEEDYEEAKRKLKHVAELFDEVDNRIALTKNFKAAMKDLGVRGGGPSLQVSPNDLRKMVRQGSRTDPGAATTGAPPALIDAISDLFLIPYNNTRYIAAQFIAGHIPEALKLFWTEIEKEAIQRLGIRHAALGSVLLERELSQIVQGLDLKSSQPFRDIAFFATTVNLTTKWVKILGAEMDLQAYDLVEALLASCAFPAAFAPRRDSDIYPGYGRRNVFFGDGGMFDNLPFLPTMQIIGSVQQARLKLEKEELEAKSPGSGRHVWREDLLRRHAQPDLFLVGALEVKQTPQPHEEYASLSEIWKRAGSLADNEKIYGFQRSAHKINSQLRKFKEINAKKSSDGPIAEDHESYLNGIVNAAHPPGLSLRSELSKRNVPFLPVARHDPAAHSEIDCQRLFPHFGGNLSSAIGEFGSTCEAERGPSHFNRPAASDLQGRRTESHWDVPVLQDNCQAGLRVGETSRQRGAAERVCLSFPWCCGYT